MSRQRLSWDKEKVAEIKTADPYTMNQKRENPPVEKYKTGDPSKWAEDPDMNHRWKSDKRTETGHPAPQAREAVKAARKLEDKAIKCITIAQRMLPGASDDLIEEQATDLMYMPDQAILTTLQRQASLAETLTANTEEEEEDAPAKDAPAKEKEAGEEKKEEAPAEEVKEEGKEVPAEKEAKKEKKEEVPEVKEEEVPAEKEAKEEKKEEKVPEEKKEEEVLASDADLLDKIFASEEIVPEKTGAKKLSGIVKKASGSDPLDSLWDAPPDVSKVFGR